MKMKNMKKLKQECIIFVFRLAFSNLLMVSGT